MKLLKNITSFIYDLDGTILNTGTIHADGWIHAGKVFNAKITPELLNYQKGRGGLDVAKKVLGQNTPLEEVNRFRQIKKEYAKKYLHEAEIFPGFEETYEYLLEKNKSIWICTSAPKELIAVSMEHRSFLKEFKDKIVSPDMYVERKPSGEPLIKTMELMGAKPGETVYVGDAYSDFLASDNADVGFIYFCPENETIEDKIPKDVVTIQNHKEISDYV